MWSMILLMFLRLGALAVFSASDNYVTLHLAIINVSFFVKYTTEARVDQKIKNDTE